MLTELITAKSSGNSGGIMLNILTLVSHFKSFTQTKSTNKRRKRTRTRRRWMNVRWYVVLMWYHFMITEASFSHLKHFYVCRVVTAANIVRPLSSATKNCDYKLDRTEESLMMSLLWWGSGYIRRALQLYSKQFHCMNLVYVCDVLDVEKTTGATANLKQSLPPLLPNFHLHLILTNLNVETVEDQWSVLWLGLFNSHQSYFGFAWDL